MKKALSIVLIVCIFLAISLIEVSATDDGTIDFVVTCGEVSEGVFTATVVASGYPDVTDQTRGNITFALDFGTTDGFSVTSASPTSNHQENSILYTLAGEHLSSGTVTFTMEVSVDPQVSPGSYTVGITNAVIENSTMSYFFNATKGRTVTYRYTSANVTPGTVTIGASGTPTTPTEVPASDITNNTGATVTGTVANGTATLNVTADNACVVAYTTDNGATYTRVNATANASGGYDFSVSDYSDSMKFVVAVKGDVSGDGSIDSDDFGPLVAGYLETGSLGSLGKVVGDLDGNGSIDSDDFGPLVAAYLGTGTIDW